MYNFSVSALNLTVMVFQQERRKHSNKSPSFRLTLERQRKGDKRGGAAQTYDRKMGMRGRDREMKKDYSKILRDVGNR